MNAHTRQFCDNELREEENSENMRLIRLIIKNMSSGSLPHVHCDTFVPRKEYSDFSMHIMSSPPSEEVCCDTCNVCGNVDFGKRRTFYACMLGRKIERFDCNSCKNKRSYVLCSECPNTRRVHMLDLCRCIVKNSV